MTKLLIVEDHPLVIEGLKNILFNSGSIDICGVATTGAMCMEQFNAFIPDVVLLDINLPDISGIELCKKIKEINSGIKILAISSFKEKSYITKMIENGASGYILKNEMPNEILYAIKEVINGNNYFNDEITEILNNELNNPKALILTRREKEVLELIAEGFTNPEIAEKLFISTLTVDSHRKNLLMKLNAKNTASLVRIALSNHIIG